MFKVVEALGSTFPILKLISIAILMFAPQKLVIYKMLSMLKKPKNTLERARHDVNLCRDFYNYHAF